VEILSLIVGAAFAVFGPVFLVIFTIWFERKVAARAVKRLGPNRVGPWGLLQSFADIFKLIFKEISIPKRADKIPFILAPVIVVVTVLLIWAVIPVARDVVGADLSVGVLYVVALGSITTVGILVAGWSSHNKYAAIGAVRAVAQVAAYEVPVTLCLLIPVMLSGSMRMSDIVEAQPVPFLIAMPVAALIFLIGGLAEVGRAPFDLMEGESELVAGYHIEYSGMMFAMFYLADFLHTFLIAALFVILFWGGWQGPGAENSPLLGFLYFAGKTALVYFGLVWSRVTLPRLRIDHMLNLSWKVLTPVMMALIVGAAVVIKAVPVLHVMPADIAASQSWPILDAVFGAERMAVFLAHIPQALALLALNLAVGMVTLAALSAYARRQRREIEDWVDEAEFSAHSEGET
jgi:NADH-quinone oxidoreductase subunit H